MSGDNGFDLTLNIGRLTDLVQTRDLKTFLAVAETGSFRKAGRALVVGQSAVTRRIQKLEDSLGVSLFERRPDGARLTHAGWSFAERARLILNELHAAFDAAHYAGLGGIGTLNVGLIASLSHGVLRNVVNRFAAENSEVEVAFVESERGELLTLLSHRLLDVVVASGDFGEMYGDSAVLVKEPIYIALEADDRLARMSRLTWNDVRDAHFLVSAAEPGPEIHEYLIRRLAGLGRRPQVTHHRLGREGIMNLVGLGFGVSLVAEHWCGVSYPGVIFRPVGEPGECVRFSIVWRPENDNPALRRFISLARTEAKRNGVLS
ncbi:LysR family transcriptional regulator [Afifella pfennigii]|uniref:LysR family transcriptional regulator n=1 Tax=Afifella pfennigii TaxID=209897 RepID=UPI0006920F38|nr:LysR family transcriptional regulator [Afifella pfennigii]